MRGLGTRYLYRDAYWKIGLRLEDGATKSQR